MIIKRYRKKPVVIEALYLHRGLTNKDVQCFCPMAEETGRSPLGVERVWTIETLEGARHVATGEYIIKGVAGEFYPCKPDIFAQTYEDEKLMPEPEYTQGPWGPYGNPYQTPEELWTPNKGIMEVSPGLTMGSIHHTEPICRVFGYLLPVVANARLIAASPDTLESLIEVLPIAEGLLIQDCSESGEDMSPEEAAKFERAHKAIAKARGE